MKNAPFSCLLSLMMMAVLPLSSARAATNLLKGYIGASYGHADIKARDSTLISIAGVPSPSLGSFDLSRSAFQVSAGIRALEMLGAEIDYFDLGSGSASPSWSGPGSLQGAHVSQKGEAAFAVLYLPIPLIDVYFKAGAARLTTKLSATVTGSFCGLNQACPLYCPARGPCGGLVSVTGARDAKETTFAAGAGVEWKLGDWAIRGEYERFSALGEHPSLATVGVTWSFL